jgi:hypothetical protein
MFVVLKKESDVSAKWRSLILAIMLCGSVVVAGWAAYLVGDDAAGERSRQAPEILPAHIDLNSTSRFLLSDNNGQSPVLQVTELSSLAAVHGQVSLELPRAEVSGLPHPPRPVPLDLGTERPRLEPVAVHQQVSRPDRTDEIVASLRKGMKLGKVEILAPAIEEVEQYQPPAVVAVVYQQPVPLASPVEAPKPSLLTRLGNHLPVIELPGIHLPLPAGYELTDEEPSSSPHLPWRLSGGKGK